MRPSTVSRAHAVVRLRAAVEATPTVWRRADLVARWSDHTVNAAVRAGVIRRIGPALYIATAHLGTADWHASTAGRWSEPTGIVSGCAALWLHGVTAEPPTVATVAVPHTFKRPALPFIRVRRSTVSIRAIVIAGLRVAPLPDAIIHAWEETPGVSASASSSTRSASGVFPSRPCAPESTRTRASAADERWRTC